MGLFDKKYCDICGNKIGLLGNRKLEDGNLCKDCAKLLSPWFSDRKKSTIAEIREQLDYREKNKDEVLKLQPTRTLGDEYKIYLDENNCKFCVTNESKWRDANPDILDFKLVTGCDIDIEEYKREKTYTDSTTKEQKSYNPPLYLYSYTFKIRLHVNHPYFNEMEFKLTRLPIDEEVKGTAAPTSHSTDYEECMRICEEIKSVLTDVRVSSREKEIEKARPKAALVCPFCGATTTPDAAGNCEYCGAFIPVQ